MQFKANILSGNFLSDFDAVFSSDSLLNYLWPPSSLAGRVVGYNSERGPSKDHFTIIFK
jgi:hypothetical protein